MANSSSLIFGMGSQAFDPASHSTLNAAWKALADELGGEKDRAVTFRAGDQTISGTSAPRAGVSYSVDIALGDKGL